MEINDLKIFYEVAQLNSTIKTAEKLGYVQSNVSKRIAKLENDIGRCLFYRTNKGMSLTADGALFLIYAEKILQTISDMEDMFLNNKKQTRIGATQSISKNYLQDYYFNNNVAIFTKSSSELIQQLKEGTLDFIILNQEVSTNEFIKIQSIEEEVFWITGKENNNNFCENKIIVSRDVDCPYRIETLNYLKEKNIDAMIIVEVDTIDILVSILENNEAIAILPQKTMALNDRLKTIANLDCNKVAIHVYSLQNNPAQFKIQLSI